MLTKILPSNLTLKNNTDKETSCIIVTTYLMYLNQIHGKLHAA